MKMSLFIYCKNAYSILENRIFSMNIKQYIVVVQLLSQV